MTTQKRSPSLRALGALLPLAALGFACSSPRHDAPVEPERASWLELSPPATPTAFAPGVIATEGEHEFGCWISDDGREAYFGVELGDRPEIRATFFRDGAWSEPERLLGHPVYGYHDPALSPDGSRLYFISNRPLDGEGPPKDSDVWYLQRRGGAWSAPMRLPETVNSPANEYYVSFTSEGHLYFSRNVGPGDGPDSNYDLFRARWDGDGFQEAEPLPGKVNTGAYEADVFVAPDESWLIVCSTRRSGQGRGDLYRSVRDEAGNWSAVRSLGNSINGPGHELCPFVTADGRWLIYTSRQDIVAVDAAAAGLPPFH